MMPYAIKFPGSNAKSDRWYRRTVRGFNITSPNRTGAMLFDTPEGAHQHIDKFIRPIDTRPVEIAEVKQ